MKREGAPLLLAIVGLAIVALVAFALVAHGSLPERVAQVPGGSPARGVEAIERYGCGACHTIPGIDGADALVGPPLERWADRKVIAGQLPNEGEPLIEWIMHPDDVEPGTDMPDLHVTERDARDIAAYLFTLH